MIGKMVDIFERPRSVAISGHSQSSDTYPGRPMGVMFFCAALTFLAVVAAGCGGGDGGNPPAQPASRRLVQQPPQIDQTPPPAQAAAAQPGMPGVFDAPANDQAKQEPERDNDVSKWKTPDYFNAKKENDQRLLEAVQYITEKTTAEQTTAENKKFAGNETIAHVLIKLLTAEEPKKEAEKDAAAGNSPRGPGMGGPMDMDMAGYGVNSQLPCLDARTIEAVVAALDVNGSKPAKKALRDVVSGALKTDDDAVATKNALLALAGDVSPENEDVLFRALTQAEQLRPEDKNASPQAAPFMGGGYGASGALSADSLRQMTLELVETAASEDFRTKLAEYSLNSNQSMTPAAFTAISGMLIQSHPNNVGPQLMLFQSNAPSTMTKVRLAGFFTEYSETALGHLLGVFQHVEQFNFGPTPSGNAPSHGGWGSAPAKTGWGNVNASGGWVNGPAASDMTDRGLGGAYQNLPGQKPDTKQLMAADPLMPARIAKKLWSPEVAHMVGSRLDQAASLQEAGMIIPLARTMPVDEIRARLHRLMQTHWVEGSRFFLSGVQIPDANAAPGGMMMDGGQGSMEFEGMGNRGMGPGGMLAAGGAPGVGAMEFNKSLCDPGFLLLVKMLPIFDKKTGGRAARTGQYNENGVQPGMAGAGASPVDDWQKVHENLFYHFAAAFQAAARLNRDAVAVGTLPVELHSDSGIDTRFDLKWPASAADKSTPGLDPIEIHYVKISDTADASKVWKTYSRNLRTKGRMLEQGRVALLDAIKEGSTPGSKLSIDVLITRQPPGMAAAPPPIPVDRKTRKNPGEPLSVEILTIEMKDPSSTAAPAEAAQPETKTVAGGQDDDAEKAARLKTLREKAAAAKLKR